MSTLFIRITAISILTATVLFVGFVFYTILAIPESQHAFDATHSMRIYPQKRIRQTFTPILHQFNGIDLSFSNTTHTKDGAITIAIKDADCTKVIATTPVHFSQIIPLKRFVNIPFAHTITLQPETSLLCLEIFYDTHDLLPNNALPKIKTYKTDADPTHTLLNFGSKKGAAKNYDIALRLTSSKGFLADIQILIRRISQYKPLWIKDGSIIALATGTVILTFATFITLLIIGTKKW